MSDLQIRRATDDDVVLLCALNAPVQQIHHEARPDFYKPPAITDALIADYRARLMNAQVYIFVAEVDDEAVGDVVAEIIERPDNPYAYATRAMQIDQLSINPEHRNHGYGDALMAHVFALAQSLGIDRIVLGVWAFNEGAIRFYERHGFKVRDMRMEAFLEKT